MKNKILKKLNKIKKIGEQTGMKGNLTLIFTGCSERTWDNALDNITEYPIYRNNVQLLPGLNVTLCWD